MNRGAGAPAPGERGGWRWLVIGAAVVMAVVIVYGLVHARGLGHDEATYAVGARALLDGAAADKYPIYRPRAMPVMVAPAVAVSDAEWALRLPFALIAVGYALLAAALARRLGGPVAGALAFAAQVTAAPWLWRACEALSDIPAAAALVGMAFLVIDDAARPRPRPLAWLAFAALGALAFYLRSGSAPAVAALGGLAFLCYPSRRAALALAGLVLAAAIVPFLWWSHAVTGSVTGVLDLSATMGHRDYPGEGLWHYLTRWPTTVAGPVLGTIALLGVAHGLSGWRTADGHGRARALLTLAALAQMVLLGWRVHGEGRYVFFATSSLLVVGAAWLAARPRAATVAGVAIAIAAIPSAAITLWQLERLADQRAGFLRAAATISAARTAAAGQPCLVLTGNVPQAQWYTGCHARPASAPPDDATLAAFPRTFLVDAAGQKRQPDLARMTRPGLAWEPVACEAHPRWCVYRPTTTPAARP